MVVETGQHQQNQVMEEFRKSYLLSDRLIKPATVSMSKAVEKEA